MNQDVREQVRARYAAAALAVQSGRRAECGLPGTATADRGTGAYDSSNCAPAGPIADSGAAAYDSSGRAPGDEAFGAGLYGEGETDDLPAEAVLASLGCGNPVAVADLRPGERVLDLGSGGGIDVLLSARRVGPGGRAYGVEMTEEMLELARANAAQAGVANVEFLQGRIEAVPLPDASVDVVISNCVVNLSTDKPAVLAEMFRVLAPGGRIGISDVVAEDDVPPAARAERGSYVGCIAGALSRAEYLAGLAVAGFVDAAVSFTHEAVSGLHGAVVRASKPPAATPERSGTAGTAAAAGAATATAAAAAAAGTATPAGDPCCPPEAAVGCCSPESRSSCCGEPSAGLPSSCGCR